MNTYFSKEDTQMDDNHTKRCPTPLAIRWMQIQTQCDTTSHPLDRDNPNTNSNKCGWGCGDTGVLAHPGQTGKWSRFGKPSDSSPVCTWYTVSCAPATCMISLPRVTPMNAITRKNKLNIELPYGPGVLYLSIHIHPRVHVLYLYWKQINGTDLWWDAGLMTVLGTNEIIEPKD